MSDGGLSSIWSRPFSKAQGIARQLHVTNETKVVVPIEVMRFWQDVADDRNVKGTLRILPFGDKTPFGEAFGKDKCVLYVSGDPRVTPIQFIRGNGIHEIRHMEQNTKPWLIDDVARARLIKQLLIADGISPQAANFHDKINNPDSEFMEKHHEYLPEEVDAYVFEREVGGFDGRAFSEEVRLALKDQAPWPDPKKFIVPMTRCYHAAGSER